MKIRLSLMCGLVFVTANALAASTVTVCKNSSECKVDEGLESLEILPGTNGNGGAVKLISPALFSKVSGGTVGGGDTGGGDTGGGDTGGGDTGGGDTGGGGNANCPAPLLAQEIINYTIGGNTQFPSMQKGQVLVVRFVAPANHTGKISWGAAVGTNQTTSKIGVISTCPGVINSNIANETAYPCRRSSNEDSLWYSTKSNPEFDKCRLEAGKTYYANIFSGYDASILTEDYNAYDVCPSGRRCDISLNVK